MNKEFQNFSFVKTVIITSIIFLIIVILIEFLYGLTQLSFEEALLKLNNPTYLIRKFIAAIVYGLILTYYFKRKRKRTS